MPTPETNTEFYNTGDKKHADAILEEVRSLYALYGQQKPMGESMPDPRKPLFFLNRTFLGENDLLIILNTKRCRYQCWFCQLPAKSSKTPIQADDILEQFRYVVHELKHSLSIIDRITLSNEGSVLDSETLPRDALLAIASYINEIRRVRTLILETRLEFVDPAFLKIINQAAPRVKINILTGFETKNERIRELILHKRESLTMFINGMDQVAEAGADLTAYVLFKPEPSMSDEEAFAEASSSIDYLVEACRSRKISLTIRLNPMYLSMDSRWSELAQSSPTYKPPRLSDVLALAKSKYEKGIEMYVGLSTEGLDDGAGTYRSREDYSANLLKQAILFNNRRILMELA